MVALNSGFALLENLLFAAIVTDQKGLILFANSNAAKLFGYDKATLLNKNVRMLCPEPDASMHDAYLSNYVTTRKPKVLGKARNVVGIMQDGTLIPLNFTLTEQVIANNQLIFTGILRPLEETELQKMQIETRSLMIQEREMIATLPVAAVMIDDRGIIQGFNENAGQLWGYTAVEVVGRNVKMLMPAPDRDRHDGYVKRYLETGKHKVLGMGRDVIALHKEGNILALRLSVSEKKDGTKRIFTGIAQRLGDA